MKPSRVSVKIGAGLALVCALMSGCAVRVKQAQRPVLTREARVAEILYVTDRKEVVESREAGGAKKKTATYEDDRERSGELSYGMAGACVPGDHRLGEELPEKPDATCAALKDAAGTPGSPGAGELQRLDHDAFFGELEKRLEGLERRRILVFVHGYDFRFAEGVRWTAQLKADLDFAGPVILYSWPSGREPAQIRARRDERRMEHGPLGDFPRRAGGASAGECDSSAWVQPGRKRAS